MNIISSITTALSSLNLPAAVGMYEVPKGGSYPAAYIVITPLDERNDDIADDAPLTETSGVDVNLYMQGNYQATKGQMKNLLETAGFFIEDRRYIGYEPDTKHHHYVITVEAKEVL